MITCCEGEVSNIFRLIVPGIERFICSDVLLVISVIDDIHQCITFLRLLYPLTNSSIEDFITVLKITCSPYYHVLWHCDVHIIITEFVIELLGPFIGKNFPAIDIIIYLYSWI